VVGRIEAQWGSLLMVMQSAVRWTTTVAQTSGFPSRTLGQEAVDADEEACGTVGWPSGGQSAVVDGDQRRRRRQCGEQRVPASLAGNSGYNRVLRDEGAMADRIFHSDDGGAQWQIGQQCERVEKSRSGSERERGRM
jgi:hypothetical protein